MVTSGFRTSSPRRDQVEQVDREDRRFGDRLFERVDSDGHHGDSAVQDLRVAHSRRVAAERIEAEHAGQVVLLRAVLLVQPWDG